jgi:diaminopimelate epimerase
VTFEFTKMHGAANDFVMIDHREPFLPADPAALFARLCDRHRGIGADGVLVLERHESADFRMRYHNSDGGPADFCGNGARCIAAFALSLGLGQQGRVRFETAVGEKLAQRLGDGRIALGFGPVGLGRIVRVESEGRTFTGFHVNTGVPHFVVPVPDVADVPLLEWARPLRFNPIFGAEGANIDFYSKRADGRVAMRTYERGVEGETLACGSGAIATAIAALADRVHPPVTVRTAGGDDLVVAFADTANGPEVTLTGPVQVVYQGRWDEASS